MSEAPFFHNTGEDMRACETCRRILLNGSGFKHAKYDLYFCCRRCKQIFENNEEILEQLERREK